MRGERHVRDREACGMGATLGTPRNMIPHFLGWGHSTKCPPLLIPLCSETERSALFGFYSSDVASFDDLCIQADQNLFNKVLHNPHHVLHRLLLPVSHTSHNYCLRPRSHDRSLPERPTHLTDCNLIISMLFYKVYWQHLIPACFIVSCNAFWQFVKYTDMLCYCNVVIRLLFII